MTIKAILHNGSIQPVDPIPTEWVEGQELLIEEPEAAVDKSEIARWAEELDASTKEISPEEHEQFERALEEIERSSKEAIKQEWGLQ